MTGMFSRYFFAATMLSLAVLGIPTRPANGATASRSRTPIASPGLGPTRPGRTRTPPRSAAIAPRSVPWLPRSTARAPQTGRYG